MDHNNSEATLPSGALSSTQNEPSTLHSEHLYQPGYHSPDHKFRSASGHDFFGSGPKRLAFSPPYELKDLNELNQSPDAMFPILVQDKFTKLSARFRKRASSPLQHDTFESTVEESIEEDEMDKHTLPKFKIFADEEEFNVKNTNLPRFRGRREFFSGNLNRCKSLDTNNLLLDQVQEAKIEEDLNPGLERNRKMTWNIFHDKNEFNKEPKRRGSVGFSSENRYKKFSLQSANSKDTIVEEQERRILPNLHSPFSFLGQINLSSANSSSHGSLHGSYHNSPKFKLKVDEIDIMEKDKKFEEENEYEDIEMILEEAEEKHLAYQDNREFQAAMHKLHEEKEFMKKVIKGDVIGEDEATYGEKDYMYMKSETIQEENEDELKPETGKN
jgi:hypothetical protein